MPIATAITAEIKVVDASALAAILFGEPEADGVAERLTGFGLAAPDFISLELANICLKKARRYPQSADKFAAAFRFRRRWAIDERPVDHDAVLDLASRTGLTAYDATYLWLARHLGAELVTLDRQLAQAAAAP